MLRTISGFGALTSITGNCSFQSNSGLTSIEDFGVLTSIGGNLTVKGNSALSSCCGLLRIADNTATVSGSTTIAQNAAGCNSKGDITGNCKNTIIISQDTDVPDDVATLTSIDTNLTISGTITTFPNYAALEVIEGNLVIDNITTATLTDLNNIFPALTEVQGNLRIQNNAHVETISGFVALDNIGKALTIQNNTALTTLPALGALATITRSINILSNAALTDLPAFSSITTVAGITIRENNALTSISIFPALTSTTGILNIRNNAKLTSISGF